MPWFWPFWIEILQLCWKNRPHRPQNPSPTPPPLKRVGGPFSTPLRGLKRDRPLRGREPFRRSRKARKVWFRDPFRGPSPHTLRRAREAREMWPAMAGFWAVSSEKLCFSEETLAFRPNLFRWNWASRPNFTGYLLKEWGQSPHSFSKCYI